MRVLSIRWETAGAAARLDVRSQDRRRRRGLRRHLREDRGRAAAAYRGGAMSTLRCHISISLDGYVAGPNQSEENPLGEGGELLHDWAVSLAAWRESHDKQGGEANESTRIMEETLERGGAGVGGRNLLGRVGGGDGGEEEWNGWLGGRPAV